jgi:hypothetical protein
VHPAELQIGSEFVCTSESSDYISASPISTSTNV